MSQHQDQDSNDGQGTISTVNGAQNNGTATVSQQGTPASNWPSDGLLFSYIWADTTPNTPPSWGQLWYISNVGGTEGTYTLDSYISG